MRKLRVLHVAQSAGGVDRFLRSLIKNLDKDRYDNILICSNDFCYVNYKNYVSEFYQLGMTRDVSLRDLCYVYKLRKLLTELKLILNILSNSVRTLEMSISNWGEASEMA